MTSIKPTKTLALSLTIASLSACGAPGEETAVQPVKTAHFRVTEKIINPDVQPFTATISGFGNSVFTSGMGFEPVIYRNSYIDTQDAPDRIVA